VDQILRAFTSNLQDCHERQLDNFRRRDWREPSLISEKLLHIETHTLDALREARTPAQWSSEWPELRSRLRSQCELGMVPLLNALLFELSTDVFSMPDSCLHHTQGWPVSPLSLRRFTGNAQTVSLALCAWLREQDATLDLMAEARHLRSEFTSLWGAELEGRVDILPNLFFRPQWGYVVGRMGSATHEHNTRPLCLALQAASHSSLRIDAMLTSEADVLRMFDSTPSPFITKLSRPDQVLSFLISLMPTKSPSWLAAKLGHRQWAHLLRASELAQFLDSNAKNLESTGQVSNGSRTAHFEPPPKPHAQQDAGACVPP
jgi:hypothetical protein